MASSSSFTAFSGVGRTMLGGEIIPLGEANSSEHTASLLGEEESS